jgi:hypothetical protein
MHAPDAAAASMSPCYKSCVIRQIGVCTQVALTGDIKPSRAALEHHTAELETELLHMHSQCGQLKVRLAMHADNCTAGCAV